MLSGRKVEIPEIKHSPDSEKTILIKREDKMAPIGSTSLISQIPEFDGDSLTVSIGDFTRAVKEAQTLAGWTDEATCSIIKLRLRGGALLFIKNDPPAKVATTGTALLAALEKRYGRTELSGNALQELTYGVQQGPTETVRNYVGRFREVLSRACPDAAQEATFNQIGHYYFMKGLIPSIQRFVLSKNHKTLEDAIAEAIKEELNAQYLARNPTPVGDYDGLASRIASLEISQTAPTKPERTCFNCGSRSHLIRNCTAPRRSDVVRVSNNSSNNRQQCYNCQGFGHFAKVCPSNNARARSPMRNRQVRFQSRSPSYDRDYNRSSYKSSQRYHDRRSSPSPRRQSSPSPNRFRRNRTPERYRSRERSFDRNDNRSRFPTPNSPSRFPRTRRSPTPDRRSENVYGTKNP